jgi:hypothetical protein
MDSEVSYPALASLHERKKYDGDTTVDSPLLTTEQRELAMHYKLIGAGNAQEPGAICAELQCNVPTLPCNHTKRLRAAWDVGYTVTVVLQALANNVMYAFVLALLTIAFKPSGTGATFLGLVIYAFGIAATVFFGQIAWSAYTGGYGNGVTSLVMWIIFSYSNRARKDISVGNEFVKILIFWFFQTVGRFGGVALAMVPFITIFAGFSYGKPVIGTLLGDPGLPVLTLYQSIAFETLASIVIYSMHVIAHTTSYIRASTTTSAFYIAAGHFAARLLFGWYTGAIADPLYWAVTAIYSGNYAGWEAYIFGPLIGATLVVLFFMAYSAARAYVCKEGDGCPVVQITPEMEEMYREQGRQDVYRDLQQKGVTIPPDMMPGGAGTQSRMRSGY